MDASEAYRELDVPPGSGQPEIKSRYRKLVLELHPDRNEGRNEARLKRITKAYHVLKDATMHEKSVQEQRTAQNARNTMRTDPGGERRRASHRAATAPEEDWSRFTAEFEEDASFWKAYENNFWRDYEKRRASASGPRAGGNGAGQSRRGSEPKDAPGSATGARAVPRYGVRIEKSLCIGCCSCETIAPGMFHIDKRTKVNPKSSVTDPLGAGLETIMDAAQTCPTKAIIVDDAAAGRRLYPL